MSAELSVVIPTFNRKAILLRTLPTVWQQTLPADRFEVIVVDDGSADGTVEALRGMPSPVALRVESITHRGISAARNAGIRVARGQWILFLDDDILCDERMLEEHLKCQKSGAASVSFGRIVHARESGSGIAQQWSAEADRQMEASLAASSAVWPLHATVDANCCVARQKLLAAGLYDETLHARENLELGLRLWKQLGPFTYVPEARGEHLYSKPAATLAGLDAERGGREELEICRRHPEYRRYSALAALGEGGWWHRKFRAVLARSPVSFDPVLAAAFHTCRLAGGLRAFRSAARRLLTLRYANTFYRSAAKATGGWKALIAEFGQRLPVLMYHNVGPPQSEEHAELTVSAEKFRRQMQWIARFGFHPISTRQWNDWLERGTPLPSRPVLLTFDDASKHLIDSAFPELQRRGFPATVFAITRWLGGNMTWDGCAVMTAEELKAWHDRGIEFGGHTRTHVKLTEVSPEDARGEIEGCRVDLRQLTGAEPLSFAYPYGFHDDHAVAVAEKNFAFSFTTMERVNTLRTPLGRLRRTMVQPEDNAFTLFMRLHFGFSAVHILRARLQIRTRFKRMIGVA